MFSARGNLTSWCRLRGSKGDNIFNSSINLSSAEVSLKTVDHGVKDTLNITVDCLGQTECVGSFS